jgi:hypothetical protein
MLLQAAAHCKGHPLKRRDGAGGEIVAVSLTSSWPPHFRLSAPATFVCGWKKALTSSGSQRPGLLLACPLSREHCATRVR